MTEHKSVLLKESIDGLNIHAGDIIVDGTLNVGGHGIEICKLVGEGGMLIGIDQDSDALSLAKQNLMGCSSKVSINQGNFRNFDTILDALGIEKMQGILLDIGLSNRQLEDSGRGFSFKHDEPLLMTFNTSDDEYKLTAIEIVNEWEEDNIADVLYGYGGERYSRRIAKGIAEARTEQEIRTTTQLVDIIKKSVPALYRHKKIHPATKTFQALRIAVNDELGALKEVIAKAEKRLSKGGRIVIISFHSGEDRIVKHLFREYKEKGVLNVLTKKPITASEEELKENPKSRSALLRVAEKI